MQKREKLKDHTREDKRSRREQEKEKRREEEKRIRKICIFQRSIAKKKKKESNRVAYFSIGFQRLRFDRLQLVSLLLQTRFFSLCVKKNRMPLTLTCLTISQKNKSKVTFPQVRGIYLLFCFLLSCSCFFLHLLLHTLLLAFVSSPWFFPLRFSLLSCFFFSWNLSFVSEPDLRIAMYGYNVLYLHRRETVSRTGKYIVLKLLYAGGDRGNIDVRYVVARGVPIRPVEKIRKKYTFEDIPQLFAEK